MRSNISEKIKNSKGDTLAETIISVLIISLASVTLAAMIGSAAKMNIAAKKYDKELDEALCAMSADSESAEPIKIKVQFNEKEYEYSVSLRSASVGGAKLSSYDYIVNSAS